MAKDKEKWYPGKYAKKIGKKVGQVGRKVTKELHKTKKTVVAGVKAGVKGAKEQSFKNKFSEACKGKPREHTFTHKGKKYDCARKRSPSQM